MRVTLTKRLGQNEAGTAIDVSRSEAEWLEQRGYATREDSENASGKGSDQTQKAEGKGTDRTRQAEDKSADRGGNRRSSGRR